MAALKKLGNLQGKTTAFFLCDMQERFRPAIHGFEDIVTVAKRLVSIIFFTRIIHRQFISLFKIKCSHIYTCISAQGFKDFRHSAGRH